MKPKKLITTLILITVTVTVTAAEKKQTRVVINNKEKITFKSYLATIRKKLPEIQKNRLVVDKAKNSLYASKAQEDFNLSSSFQYFFENPTPTSPATTIDSTSGFTSSVGVNKKFVETGTQVSSGIEYDSTNIKSGTSDTTSYTPAVYLNITQPLLNNAFGMVDRYAKNNARMQLAIEKLKKKENLFQQLPGNNTKKTAGDTKKPPYC